MYSDHEQTYKTELSEEKKKQEKQQQLHPTPFSQKNSITHK